MPINGPAEEYVRFVDVNATPSALTTRTVEEASGIGDELRKVIQTGRFDECKSYAHFVNELSVIRQLVLRGGYTHSIRTFGHGRHQTEPSKLSVVACHG